MSVNDFLTHAIAVLGGAGGFAALYRFAVRPRTYSASRHQRLVGFSDEDRRSQIEDILTKANQPTALVEAEFWNSGFRTATNLTLTVEVPGKIIHLDVSENTEAKASSAVEPARLGESRITFTKVRLTPRGRCRFVVGFQASYLYAFEPPKVLAYQGDKEVGPPDATFRALVATIFALGVCAAVIVGVLMSGVHPLFGAFASGASFSAVAVSAALLSRYVHPGRPSWLTS